jgi:predicted DNA-binding transcriptional regulator YafY
MMTSSVIYFCQNHAMRADRLLSIIWLLRTHGQLSAGDLAGRLEVSRRTILRDVEALSAAGVPVYCERGPRGGVTLLPGYRTDVTGLTSEEARALFAAVTTWGAASLGLGEALASGLRKLLAAVPESHRAASADMARRIVVDPQGWLPETDGQRRQGVLETVQAAVFEQRYLRFRYRPRRSGETHAVTVAPHGLLAAGNAWYVCGGQGGATRFYRLSRIESAEVLEPCPESDVDVAAEWRQQRAEFLEGLEGVTVTAWLRDDRSSDVADVVLAADPLEPAGAAPEPSGWNLWRLEFSDQAHAVHVLLNLGGSARIVAPDEVREAVLSHAQAVIAAQTTAA